MFEGASFVLGPPRPPPHGRGGLIRFGTIGGPCRMGEGASFSLGPPRPPPHKEGLSGYGARCFRKKTRFVFFCFFHHFWPFLAAGWCFFMFFGVFLFFQGGIRYKRILWYQASIVF